MTETPPYTPFGVDYITELQFEQLRKWLNPERVERRSESGRSLSYLNQADVRAHMSKIFGFLNWDAEVVASDLVFVEDRLIGKDEKPGFEVTCTSTVTLRIRSISGRHLCTYTEVAAASNAQTNKGAAYETALKSATSDALKRCCINLGDQFGLGLYRKGDQRSAFVNDSLVSPVRFGAKQGPAEREVVDLQRGGEFEQEATVPAAVEDDPYAALDAVMPDDAGVPTHDHGTIGGISDGQTADDPSEGWGGGMAAAIERAQYERDMTMASGGGAEAADGAYAAQLDREGITRESVAAERARRDAEHQEAAIQRTKEKVAQDFEQREF